MKTLDSRYYVLKHSDITDHLTMEEMVFLRRIRDKISGKRLMEGHLIRQFVVIESDWPEYQPACQALIKRIKGASMTEESNRAGIVHEILAERQRQQDAVSDDESDRSNTKNDWCGFITAYAGRGVAKCHRNEREGQDFRANMIKVAALALAAVEAYDNGYC